MKTFIALAILVAIHFQLQAQTDTAKFYFTKGMDEKNARRYMVASGYFDKAIKADPGYGDAYVENGRTNLEMRKVDAAQAYLFKAYQLQPDNIIVINELSNLYFNNRQFQKAIELAQKCKTCADADKIIAMSNFNLEDYSTAVTGLKKYLVKNPTDAEATYTLAKSYFEMEEFKNAIPPYQKAVMLDPTKAMWRYELGLIFYNQDDFANALKYFKMAEDAGYNKTNDFYENIGFAYLFTGDVENGTKNLQFLLKRKPNDKELLTNIADALYKAQKYDDALGFYQRLLENDPKNSNALYMAGMAFQKKGDKEKGKGMCDAAIKMDPSLAKNRTKMGSESFGL